MSSLPPALRYRGREGMLAWAFHRISGVGIFAFVLLHVLDIYLVGGNPQLYDDVLAFYASVPGRLLEVVLGAALLYHALNGLRIIVIDLWPAMTVYHRTAVVGHVGHLHRASACPGALIILRPVWYAVPAERGHRMSDAAATLDTTPPRPWTKPDASVSPVTRARRRPRNRRELYIWYLMRITGLALFVLALAHFSILHFIWDPAQQNAEFIAQRSAGTSSSGAASTGCC